MPSPRTRYVPPVEVLEGRQLLDAGLPADTLEVVAGTVSTPGGVAEVSVPVTATNINGKSSILIGLATSPTAGSGVNPQVISARGPDGRSLPVLPGFPYVPGVHAEATTFVQVSHPGTVTLEVRGQSGTAGAFQVREYLPGDINGDHKVTFADLKLFPDYFLTVAGGGRYNAAADANLNGQVGIEDAKLLVRNLNPGVPKTPVMINLALAPGEDLKTHIPSNSGGHTYFENPIIVGRTTPGSIVFTDNSLGNYEFAGPAVATDEKGRFAIQVKNKDGINNNDFMVVTPFGQQKIQDYPIYYFPRVYSASHPSPKPLKVKG